MFSPQGTYLASDYNTDGTLRIWSVQTGQQVASLSGHNTRVEQAVFTTDERFAATSDFDGTFRIWSLTTRQSKIVNIDAGDWMVKHSIAASPDGQKFAVGSNGTQVFLVEAETGNIKQVLGKGNSSGLFYTDFVQYSPTGDSLFAITRIHNPDRSGTNVIFTLWNLKIGQPIVELVGDGCTNHFWASFGSEGALFVASSSKSQTDVCNIPNLGTASTAIIHLWDVASRRKVASLTLKKHVRGDRVQVGFSPDGKFVMVDTGSEIEFWRLTPEKEPELVSSIQDHEFRAFTSDGLQVLTRRTLWGVETGKPLNFWTGSEGSDSPANDAFFVDAALSPDGTTIGLLMENSTIQLWRVQ